MKDLRQINDQKELGSFIQKFSKDEKFDNLTVATGYLSVNEAQMIARAIVEVYMATGFDMFISTVMSNIYFSEGKGRHFVKEHKRPLVEDMLKTIFKDRNRWMFSRSKKMMAKIMAND